MEHWTVPLQPCQRVLPGFEGEAFLISLGKNRLGEERMCVADSHLCRGISCDCRLESDLVGKEKVAKEEKKEAQAREAQLMGDVSRLKEGCDRMREEERERNLARQRERDEDREAMARLQAARETEQQERRGEQDRMRRAVLELEGKLEALKGQAEASEAHVGRLQGELGRSASEAALKEASLQKQHQMETQAKELVWQRASSALKADLKRAVSGLGLLSSICRHTLSASTSDCSISYRV